MKLLVNHLHGVWYEAEYSSMMNGVATYTAFGGQVLPIGPNTVLSQWWADSGPISARRLNMAMS